MPTFRLSFRRRTSYILLASDVELFLERRVREVGVPSRLSAQDDKTFDECSSSRKVVS